MNKVFSYNLRKLLDANHHNIFISYRRTDSAVIAGRVYDRLQLKHPLIFQTTRKMASVTLFSAMKFWKRSMSACKVVSGMLGMAS